MHVLKVLFKIDCLKLIEWCLPAYSFCLFLIYFFLNWYLPSMKSFLKTTMLYLSHVWIRKTNLNFFSPTCFITMWINIQAENTKENCITFFTRRWVNWLVHLNESCMQRLYCLFYHSSQRVAHVDAVTGFTFKMFLCLAAWILQMQSVCGQVQNNISLVLWKDEMHYIKIIFFWIINCLKCLI